jgi:hypothetical protein
VYGIRSHALEDFTQAQRKVSFFQLMRRAPLAKAVQQGSDLVEFVHDQFPIGGVLLHLL